MNLQGKEVITYLAGIYPQLYLVPGSEGEKKYPDIVLRGKEPEEKDLSHFITSSGDLLTREETPAGEVLTVTLAEREDFELFLQIVANRCKAVEIPKTQGSSILDGVINWTRIRAHEEEWRKQEQEKGNLSPDWDAEFKRFTSDKRNYSDALILLSVGPYSAVKGEAFGYENEEWLRLSGLIRRYHEGTHFICRRLYPEKIDPIWDELVADAAGILGAFGRYDQNLAEAFLGIDEKGYRGGRLENYVTDEDLQDLSRRSHRLLCEFSQLIESRNEKDPYQAAILLEEKKEELDPLLKKK